MTRFLCAAVIGCFLALFGVQPAHAQLGFAAGLNLDRVSDIDLFDSRATFDNSNGWHLEVWFDVPLGAMTFRPGLRYMDAGRLYKGFSEDYRDVEDDFAVTLLEVPLNLRYRLGEAVTRPYVVGGPVLRFPAADDRGLNDDLRTVSVAGGLGLGLEVPLGGLTLFPELTYTFGVSSFVKDEFRIGNRTFVTDEAQYLNAVMLRLGLGL